MPEPAKPDRDPAKPDPAGLLAPMAAGDLVLAPLEDAHLEPLRAVCAEDTEIWEIYIDCLVGEHFGPAIAHRRATPGGNFAICLADEVIGITAFLRPDVAAREVEIGGTFLAPRLRGTGVNGRIKRLMMDRAFASGFATVRFNIDERNTRSQAAVAKLGARRAALLPADKTTWTGFVRNTVVYLLRPEDRI